MGYTSGDVLTAAELNTFTPSAKIENAIGSAASPSYTFTGDTDTGMYRSAADELSFATAGVERMEIDSAGKVGIGINPTVPLEVSSGTDNVAILAGSTDATCRINMFDSASTGNSYVGIGAISDDLGFWSGNNKNMTLKDDGTLGIGDTTPQSQIDVKSPDGTRAFHFHCQGDVGAGAVTGGIMQIGAGSDSTNPGTDSYFILFRRGNGTTIGSVKGTGSASVNFATTSDMTLKSDNGLVTEERIGSIMDTLQVHDFDWNEGTVTDQIGLFAQEAIDVLPESIVNAPSVEPATADEDEMYVAASLDYSKIVPILIAECQFLRQRVEALEAA